LDGRFSEFDLLGGQKRWQLLVAADARLLAGLKIDRLTVGLALSVALHLGLALVARPSPGGGGDGARTQQVSVRTVSAVHLAQASSAVPPPVSTATRSLVAPQFVAKMSEPAPQSTAEPSDLAPTLIAPSESPGKLAAEATTGTEGSYYLRSSEVDQGAKPREMRDPEFPQGTETLTGFIVVEIYVNELGFVDEARMLVSEPEGVFDEAILAAIRATKFVPAVKNGLAVKTVTTYYTNIMPDMTAVAKPRVIVPGDLTQSTAKLVER
jgi:TonB family protein